jgi:hypothetical protein
VVLYLAPTLSIMRLESIKFVLPTGYWPAGSKSSDRCPPQPLDRLGGTAFPQYKVEQLYCFDLVR